MLIANQLALVADRAFDTFGGNLSAPMAWLGSVCYTLQIYYDFSGYSDMAIGLGKMFGFHFLENFRYPYAASSITEFWRRWHISLSTWFRDYVYIPLGGSQSGSRRKTVRNLFVVWLFTGIWHGANWTFLCWGVLYFLLLYAEKFLFPPVHPPKWLGHLYTLLMVNFAWVVFRAASLPAAFSFLSAMFSLTTDSAQTALVLLYLRENWAILAAALVFSFPIAKVMGKALSEVRPDGRSLAPLMNAGYTLLVAAIFLASVSLLVKGTYNPFIYFNF
ncbi:Peptidoglycan O-acetyltransferase [bioreactor metagenome]|uniref:Peptidoglycan O-acetyltransferase n=1 Tax=bioreactor metagenome TaxID=1076179 RepID=A0A645B4F7_9ZZZZ